MSGMGIVVQYVKPLLGVPRCHIRGPHVSSGYSALAVQLLGNVAGKQQMMVAVPWVWPPTWATGMGPDLGMFWPWSIVASEQE